MMLIVWLFNALLPAGIIHGIVIENTSSRPLARTTVQLQMVTDGSPKTVATSMTNRAGQYWFPSLAAGQYLVSAVRDGYQTAHWGQRRPTGPGTVIAVQGESPMFAELRMKRLGAIMGRIVDENRVGMREVPVTAYPAKLPLSIASTGKTDDRGVFRLSGLAPGRYWVRSSAVVLEDGSGILPTYFPMSTESKEARSIAVELDGEVTDLELSPLFGRLFRLSGKAPCPRTGVRVQLSSDTLRKDTMAACPLGDFNFDGLAPANYELLASPVDSRDTRAAYQEVFLDRDNDSVRLQLTELPGVDLAVTTPDRAPVPPSEVRMLARRRDLSGPLETVPLTNRLLPGFHEIFFSPATPYYMAGARTVPDLRRMNQNQPGDAIAPLVHIRQSVMVRIAVSVDKRVATVTGAVVKEGQRSAFAPVYLYPQDEDLRRRAHGLNSVRTDGEGRFRFTNLPPGRYWLISTYDLEEINNETLEHAGAMRVELSQGEAKAVSLEMYQLK